MKLKAGDIRQDGDQQRQVNFNTRDMTPKTKTVNGKWTEVCLVGHPILASDLMHLEFKRR